jgi:hypothetical protein
VWNGGWREGERVASQLKFLIYSVVIPVIPAQAGIQFIKQFRRSRAIRFCPLRGFFLQLDSSLRWNDGG